MNEKTGKPRKLGKREKRPVMFRRGLNAFMEWAQTEAGLTVTPPPARELEEAAQPSGAEAAGA